DHIADLEYRFSYIRDYAKDWNVNGVILEWMRYCDSHGPEVATLGDYLDHIGIPHIALQQDYSEASLAPMRTRVEGFIEVISSTKAVG
ncbi:MAG: 2-hydroxyacyl-CoA dehydratase, partial [Dehalococcoidia bacterium]|nr:2-hydroxyacyl-CoA dehydratase [Dehalococcoidia bacterium]